MEESHDEVSAVWPPPPTNSVETVEETSSLATLEHFRVQSVWLVLFLSIITAGIYAIFWLRRQSLIINRLRPDLKLSVVYANSVLVFAFLRTGLDFAGGLSESESIDTWAKISDRFFGLLLLFLSFQVRAGLNSMLRVPKRDFYSFSGVYTWLFSVTYLQYKLNQNIRRWQGVLGQA